VTPVLGTDRPSSRWDRFDTASCVALVLAYVSSRILWIIGHPRSSQYWEEGYRWLASREIAAGAPWPLLDWQADHYQGSSLVVIGLAVALGWIGVGPLAALKVVALGFSTATCAALFAVGRLFFGRAVGLLCGLIYLLGPPLVAFWGVVAMGFHAESALFSLVGIGACLALARGSLRGPIAWLGFGAISGLAIWFTPTAAIGVLACVVAWPLLAERPRLAELAAAAVGLGLGLTPWLLYNATHDFAGVTRVLEVFGVAGAADPFRSQGMLDRATDLMLRAPAQGLLDPGGDGARAWWLPAVIAGVWIPAGLALAAAGRRAFATLRAGPRHGPPEARSELVFLVYGVLFVVAYLCSRFTLSVDPSPIQYRLLVPLAVLLIPPIAISAARGMGAGAGHRGLARAVCAVGLVSLAAATLAFALRHEEPGTPLTLERAHAAWGHILQRKYGSDIEAAVAAVGWLPEERREGVLVGIGWALQSAYEQTGRVADLDSALGGLDPADRATVKRGIRYWTGLSRGRLAESVAKTDDPDQRRALARLEELAAWSRPPALVLITLDTTRVDHLSCYGYERETTPNLDALAARAVRFDRAWSTSSWTLPAHASLFTGLYPLRHGADYDPQGNAVLGDVIGLPVARLMRAGKLADDATTLAELMEERGYPTGAFVAGPWLHRSFGLLQGFGHKDDGVSSFGGRPAAEITAAALSWLQGLEPGEPYFLFANYFDPHAPYEPVGRYPDLPRAREPLEYDYAAVMRGTAKLDDDTRAVLRDRYDAEIRDMDRQLGVLLEAVLARPGGERALIVVTADHGEALGEEGRLGHGFWLSEEVTRIPLLVRYPDDRAGGTRSEEPIQLVDVLSLLARELDLVLPEQAEGLEQGKRAAAFLAMQREPTTALRFGDAYYRDLQAVIRWPEKLLRSDDGSEKLLRLSPDLLSEAPHADATAAAELRRLLDSHVGAGPKAPVVPPQADPRTVEALRALGYIQ
jgi:arylsulfatase A-like enzyme